MASSTRLIPAVPDEVVVTVFENLCGPIIKVPAQYFSRGEPQRWNRDVQPLLYNLSLLSKGWHAFTAPYLYERYYGDRKLPTTTLFARTLAEAPDLGKHVRCAQYGDPIVTEDPVDAPDLDSIKCLSALYGVRDLPLSIVSNLITAMTSDTALLTTEMFLVLVLTRSIVSLDLQRMYDPRGFFDYLFPLLHENKSAPSPFWPNLRYLAWGIFPLLSANSWCDFQTAVEFGTVDSLVASGALRSIDPSIPSVTYSSLTALRLTKSRMSGLTFNLLLERLPNLKNLKLELEYQDQLAEADLHDYATGLHRHCASTLEHFTLTIYNETERNLEQWGGTRALWAIRHMPYLRTLSIWDVGLSVQYPRAHQDLLSFLPSSVEKFALWQALYSGEVLLAMLDMLIGSKELREKLPNLTVVDLMLDPGQGRSTAGQALMQTAFRVRGIELRFGRTWRVVAPEPVKYFSDQLLLGDGGVGSEVA